MILCLSRERTVFGRRGIVEYKRDGCVFALVDEEQR